MLSRSLIVGIALSLFMLRASAQDHWEEYGTEDTTRFFIGVNLNAAFPNHNTALLYSGRPNFTPFGIEHILNDPFNQQTFDNFFGAPYQVAEYPLEPRYQSGVELGMHFLYKLDADIGFFIDFNVVQLDYEQFFTIQVDDPNNNIPGPTLLRFPIIGEENRFNLNLGTQIYYYQGEGSRAFLSIFGNVNNIQMQSNYIVIDDLRYDIFHFNENSPDLQPGGNGIGGGLGLGFQFDVGENIVADLHYQIVSAEVNLNEVVSERGLQNALGIRVLWRL